MRTIPHFTRGVSLRLHALLLVTALCGAPLAAHAEADGILAASSALRTQGPDAAQALLDALPDIGRDGSERAVRLSLQGRIAAARGEVDAAMDAWRQALTLAPQFASHLRMWMAQAAMDANRSADAIQLLEQIRTDPESIHQGDADVLRAVALLFPRP